MAYDDTMIGSTRCPTCGFQKTHMLDDCVNCDPDIYRRMFEEMSPEVLERLRKAVSENIERFKAALEEAAKQKKG